MAWNDFGYNDIYVGTGGKFTDRKSKDIKTISDTEREKIAKLFSEHLLKVHYKESDGYDSSDDDRAGEYYGAYATSVYRSVDVERDVKGLVMHNGEITGVVFYVKDGNDVWANVFYFNNEPKNTMKTGYSASHSYNYITVFKVELVKKGENGAPMDADSISFIRSIRDTHI